MLSLFSALKNLLNQINGGESPAVPGNVAPSILTLAPVTTLAVTRTKKTNDALFGKVTIGNDFVCYSMENAALAIPTGTYAGRKRDSPHLGRIVLGIDVPGRTDIEGHNANLPCQLKGCIAFGSSIDNDALDNSIAALEKVLVLLPQTFMVSVTEQYE